MPDDDTTVPEPVGQGDSFFTRDDLLAAIEKARSEEKSKLYGRIEKQDSRMETLAAELESLRKDRDARQAQEAEVKKAADAAAAKAAEAELDAKALIEKRTAEFQAQLAAQQAELDRRDALLQKEREFSELRAYAQDVVSSKRDEILPELLDYITGDTREAIDASVANAIAKTRRIMEDVMQTQTELRRQAQGVSVAAPISSLEGDAPQELTAEDIQAMSFGQYAENRTRFGMDRSNRGVGLFG